MNGTDSLIVVGVADIKIGKAPDVITTSVGSCIAVCLYHPQRRVGGMLHLMLGRMGDAGNRNGVKKAKFADSGIPELLHQLKTAFGLEDRDFVAKIFGGARILKDVSYDIGRNNEEASRAVLKNMGINIIASKTGGEKGYKVKFDLSSGKVKCRIMGEDEKEY
jgi:chemotaxis protein CheD